MGNIERKELTMKALTILIALLTLATPLTAVEDRPDTTKAHESLQMVLIIEPKPAPPTMFDLVWAYWITNWTAP
jgi:hypothetical protein